MAARFKTKLYTFLNATPVTLWAALGSPVNDKYGQSVTLRAGSTNVGNVYWQNASAERGGYLDAGEAATMDLAGMWVSAEDIYLSGTQDDTLYITVLG